MGNVLLIFDGINTIGDIPTNMEVRFFTNDIHIYTPITVFDGHLLLLADSGTDPLKIK